MNKVIIEKLHTTELGAERIKRNLSLDVDNVVEWCKEKINNPNSHFIKKGKNWYVTIDDCVLTINVSSHTIITAHKNKNKNL